MPPTAERSRVSFRILAEALQPPDEPLTLLLTGDVEATPAAACGAAARALLDLPAVSPRAPSWLAPHQVPAHDRLVATLTRYDGAVLADAAGLGKSYVALAVARSLGMAPTLVVPAVLIPQWRALLTRLTLSAQIWSHERLSRDGGGGRWPREPATASLYIVDEAHHFRNPDTRRYRALAKRVVGSRVLLVSATPVHHRAGELLHLLRLFLRDDALVAVGIPSLIRAARDPNPGADVLAAVARFVVARSRHRVQSQWHGVKFPQRTGTATITATSGDRELMNGLVRDIGHLCARDHAGALLRLTLLRRLASSVPALRESLRRLDALCAVGLPTGAFHRLFPMADGADLQLAFLPLLPEAVESGAPRIDVGLVRRLLDRVRTTIDPKADALARLLADTPARTIVFCIAAATVHHLRRCLANTFRVGSIVGTKAWLGTGRSTRREVLESFAPHAHGVRPPPGTRRVDVLIATDLLGEGLNLQDAERVVHYDLPWSPARLAQRVGRVDRLASPHAIVSSVTFLPAEPLASALALECRLARKVMAQRSIGAAQVETPRGPEDGEAPLDWCDQLQPLAAFDNGNEATGQVTAVAAMIDACVLIARLGGMVEAIVVENGVASTDPRRATTLMVEAAMQTQRPVDRQAVVQAIRVAAPLVRQREGAVAAARWRTADRDGAGRRLVPMVLAAARRAAHAGQGGRLARLDALVARLCSGLTAGETLLLEDLIERRRPLDANDLLAWHEGLPAPDADSDRISPSLIAAICCVRAGNRTPTRA